MGFFNVCSKHNLFFWNGAWENKKKFVHKHRLYYSSFEEVPCPRCVKEEQKKNLSPRRGISQIMNISWDCLSGKEIQLTFDLY